VYLRHSSGFVLVSTPSTPRLRPETLAALEMSDTTGDTRFWVQRREELARLARERGIDWEDRLKSLPREDDRVLIAALAGLLQLEIRGAFSDARLDELERRSEALRADHDHEIERRIQELPEAVQAALRLDLEAAATALADT
jgi:hypothetical protein